MKPKTLGFRKEAKPTKGKIVHFEPFEIEFMEFWQQLGFKTTKDKTAKYYKKSVRYLRYLLKGEKFFWLEKPITVSELKNHCITFKAHAELNGYSENEGKKCDLKKFYFHQFVLSFSGHSFLRDIIEKKIGKLEVNEDLELFAQDVAKLIKGKLNRDGGFSSGEYARILKFSQSILDFWEKNNHKIAFGVDKLSIVKGSYSIIKDFTKLKGINPNILIYTGNYAAGAALEQAMEQFGYWKIYSKYEAPDASVKKDIEKTKKVMEKITKKEEEDLPEIVKRRREEMKKNGIEVKTKKEKEEDCSRRDEFLNRKKTRRNPFSK